MAYEYPKSKKTGIGVVFLIVIGFLFRKSLWNFLLAVGSFFADVAPHISNRVFPDIIWGREYDGNVGAMLFTEAPAYKDNTAIDMGWYPILSFNGELLKEGISFNTVNSKGIELLKLEPKKDGTVLLSIDIFNSKGEMVAKVVNNELVYFIEKGYLFNLDGVGFEVLDTDFLVLFNIEYKKEEIKINGVLYDNDCSWVILGDPKPEIITNFEDLICEYRQGIDLMFCYVGKDYLHKRPPCERD